MLLLALRSAVASSGYGCLICVGRSEQEELTTGEDCTAVQVVLFVLQKEVFVKGESIGRST